MLGALALAVIAAYPLIVGNAYLRYIGVLVLMYATLSTSWNVMGGTTGYTSLGHSAFFGLGAYATGLLVTDGGWHSGLAVLAATAGVGVLALGIGYVAVRVRGASFVIVTIALVYIFGLIAQGWRGLTGGSSGLSVPATFEGLTRGQAHQVYFYAFLALLAVALGIWALIDRTKYGMALKSIREDEDKAESLGVSTTLLKVVTFGISAALTGAGGGLYALWFGFLDPIFAFAVLFSAEIVLMALLGGTRELWGPTIGALLVLPATQYFLVQFGETQLHLVLVGLLLVFVVLVMPDGIAPAVRGGVRRLRGGPASASIRERQPDRAPDEATEAQTSSEVGS